MNKNQYLALFFTLALLAIMVGVAFKTSKSSVKVDGSFYLGQEHLACYVGLNALHYESLVPPFEVETQEFFVVRSDGKQTRFLRYTYSKDRLVQSLSGRMQNLEYRGLELIAGNSSSSDAREIFGEPNHTENDGKDHILHFQPLALYLVFSDDRFVGFSLNEIENSEYSLGESWKWHNPKQVEELESAPKANVRLRRRIADFWNA